MAEGAPLTKSNLMNEGAFALLDCLGFKGIWDGHPDPGSFIGFLKKAEADINQSPLRALWRQSPAGEEVHIAAAFLSDTFVASASVAPGVSLPLWLKGTFVNIVSNLCIDVMTQFAQSAPKPLLFRGCITYGSHLVQDSFYLGPAVDEAATLFEAGQGAFVWLTPNAENLVNAFRAEMPSIKKQYISPNPQEHLDQAEIFITNLSKYSQLNRESVEPIVAWWNSLVVEKKRVIASYVLDKGFDLWRTDEIIRNYPMELKSGGHLNAALLNPLFRIPVITHGAVLDRMMSSFNRLTLDVLVKKQNTERFLSHASNITKVAQSGVQGKLNGIREDLSKIIGSSF